MVLVVYEIFKDEIDREESTGPEYQAHNPSCVGYFPELNFASCVFYYISVRYISLLINILLIYGLTMSRPALIKLDI